MDAEHIHPEAARVEYVGKIGCACGGVVKLIDWAYVAWCRVCGQKWDIDWELSKAGMAVEDDELEEDDEGLIEFQEVEDE